MDSLQAHFSIIKVLNFTLSIPECQEILNGNYWISNIIRHCIIGLVRGFEPLHLIKTTSIVRSLLYLFAYTNLRCLFPSVRDLWVVSPTIPKLVSASLVYELYIQVFFSYKIQHRNLASKQCDLSSSSGNYSLLMLLYYIHTAISILNQTFNLKHSLNNFLLLLTYVSLLRSIIQFSILSYFGLTIVFIIGVEPIQVPLRTRQLSYALTHRFIWTN